MHSQQRQINAICALVIMCSIFGIAFADEVLQGRAGELMLLASLGLIILSVSIGFIASHVNEQSPAVKIMRRIGGGLAEGRQRVWTHRAYAAKYTTLDRV
jgi:hypothetical protein